MTDQLKAALDALNACQTADDVASLLRRHGVRASVPIDKGPRCPTCPLAVYLRDVGGVLRASVMGVDAIVKWRSGRSKSIVLGIAAAKFIKAADGGAYRDLEAA